MATAFRAAGLKPPDPRIMTYSVPLCQHLVATGRVITMLQVSVVRIRKRSPLKPLSIASPEISRTVGLVTLKNRTLIPVAQLFIEHAREVAKPLAKHRPWCLQVADFVAKVENWRVIIFPSEDETIRNRRFV